MNLVIFWSKVNNAYVEHVGFVLITSKKKQAGRLFSLFLKHFLKRFGIFWE